MWRFPTGNLNISVKASPIPTESSDKIYPSPIPTESSVKIYPSPIPTESSDKIYPSPIPTESSDKIYPSPIWTIKLNQKCKVGTGDQIILPQQSFYIFILWKDLTNVIFVLYQSPSAGNRTWVAWASALAKSYSNSLYCCYMEPLQYH